MGRSRVFAFYHIGWSYLTTLSVKKIHIQMLKIDSNSTQNRHAGLHGTLSENRMMNEVSSYESTKSKRTLGPPK